MYARIRKLLFPPPPIDPVCVIDFLAAVETSLGDELPVRAWVRNPMQGHLLPSAVLGSEGIAWEELRPHLMFQVLDSSQTRLFPELTIETASGRYVLVTWFERYGLGFTWEPRHR